MMTYDPAFTNTAACRSRITYIDGDRGILMYRGYPIEQLAEHSDYLETAYLILFGELPTLPQLEQWTQQITRHTMLHENIKKFLEGFRYDAHPMGMFLSAVGALSTFYPDAKNIFDPASRRLQTRPADRQGAEHRRLRVPPHDRPAVRAAGQRAELLRQLPEHAVQDDRAASTSRTRSSSARSTCCSSCTPITSRTAARTRCAAIGSSHADPYSSLAGAAAALYGPLHGGANEAVLRMLTEIGSIDNVPAFIKRVKAGDGRLMGFGHRVYKSYDPRATIIKRIADLVFEVTGQEPAARHRAGARTDRARRTTISSPASCIPNVDFYSGLIYQAMGFPVDMFPVLFAIPRTAGWIAQWEEMLTDPEQKIARPRQIYVGPPKRDYVSRDKTALIA